MKIAVGSLGTSLDAWVGGRFGYCPQFVIVDTETMDYLVVPMPEASTEKEASQKAIRTVVRSGAELLIVQQAMPTCREVMNQLGVEVIQGVEGLTVRQVIERYQSGRLAEPAGRKGEPPKIAVVADGATLDAPVGSHFGQAPYLLVVDPVTMGHTTLEVTPDAPGRRVTRQTLRALVESGAGVVITPAIGPECCQALWNLAIEVVVGGQSLTVRQVVERYQSGELAQAARLCQGGEV